jgi:hypothetical protein
MQQSRVEARCSFFTGLLHFLLLFSIGIAASNDGEYSSGSYKMIIISTIFLMIEVPDIFGLEQKTPKAVRPPHRNRRCCSVGSIFDEMGPNYVKQAYRMDSNSFWKLHKMLQPYLH